MITAIPLDRGNAMRFVGNGELLAREKAAAEAFNNTPVIQGIAAHVRKCWFEAQSAKDSNVMERMLDAQSARAGKYDVSTLAAIREFGGSEEFARITANKCRVAEAWIRDVFIGQTEKAWTIQPTPVPDLPPDTLATIKQQIAQEFATSFILGVPTDDTTVRARTSEITEAERERARDSARRSAEGMEKKMHDQLVEGGWTKALAEFISDLVTYPAAIMKGPVFRRRQRVKWVSEAGRWVPKKVTEVVPEFERVDPFNIYPSPGSSCPQEGFIIQLHTLSRTDVYDLIGLEGYDEEAIRAVLREYGTGGLQDWVKTNNASRQSYATGEQPKVSGSSNVTIDALEYHGAILGSQLLEWGVTPEEVPDPDKEYESCVWLIDRWVIKAQLNYDPLGRRPYYKASYEDVPGAFWGNGLPDILADMQGVVNAAVRALVNNAGFCSSPMAGVNVERLPAGEDLSDMYPGKIFQFQESKTGSSLKPIEFFQPESRVMELLAVVEKAYEFADNFSLIPRVMHGNAQATIGRTASGMSMMLDAANKGLKGVVSGVDVNVITPVLEALYDFNMVYDEDEAIKGDSKVVARGAVSLMQLESLQLRRNEFLMATNNPLDAQIVGVTGRAEILRETAKGLQMDINRVVPRREQLEGMQLPQEGQQPPQQPGGAQLDNGAAVTDNFGNNALRGGI